MTALGWPVLWDASSVPENGQSASPEAPAVVAVVDTGVVVGTAEDSVAELDGPQAVASAARDSSASAKRRVGRRIDITGCIFMDSLPSYQGGARCCGAEHADPEVGPGRRVVGRPARSLRP